MNIVMDEAVEVYVKDAKPKRELGKLYMFLHFEHFIKHQLPGRILLKGDNITLIQQLH
jgi:small nuclear ribonucleoprotein E